MIQGPHIQHPDNPGSGQDKPRDKQIEHEDGRGMATHLWFQRWKRQHNAAGRVLLANKSIQY